MANRWWVYQKERFPIFKHGLLIALFSFCALSYSSLLRGVDRVPSFPQIVTAFLTVFLFFFMLRVADEFKDADEDARYRPYRPVPRGLVKLRELGALWIAAAVVQLALCLWLDPRLLPILIVAWLYLGLMTREFFAREWLKARPVAYLLSHMLIMPLVDLYATACDWLVAGHGRAPAGIVIFLVVSFFSGIVLEFGRKIRAPQDEERGVETYSFLWGPRIASAVWLAALSLGGVFASVAAARIHFMWPTAVVLAVLYAACLVAVAGYVREPTTKASRRIEDLSGVWVLAIYLMLGTVPLVAGG